MPEYSKAILTSAEKRIDVAVFDTIKKNAGGDMGGENFLGTLANDGVALSPFHDLDAKIPAELKAEVDQLAKDIASGSRQGLRLPEVGGQRTPSHPLSARSRPPRAGARRLPRRKPSMRLELKDITKRFPGVLANDRISIAAERGEVLGLLGENGAGKSTLMNILSGLYRPDSGEILIDGTARTFTDPRQAIDAGIGMVHQHFELVPVFDVVEAVSLGAESVTGPVGTLDRTTARQARRGAEPAVRPRRQPGREDRGPPGWRAPAGGDPQGAVPAERHPGAGRALGRPHPFETEELFGIIRSLALRPARPSSSSPTSSTRCWRSRTASPCCAADASRARSAPADATREILANLMVGRDVELRVAKAPASPGDVVLSVKDLHVRDDRDHAWSAGLSLEVRAGEIVALAGVQGNGQTELVEAIMGLRPVDSGEIVIDGHDDHASSARRVSELGVAHVPEDRMRDGLIGAMTVAENFILDTYHREPYSGPGHPQRAVPSPRGRLTAVAGL